MAYATKDDIIASGVTGQELLELADDANTNNIADAGVVSRIDAAIADGSSTVESYCRQRYSLPLQQSNKVTSLVVDLAVYALFARRRKVPQDVKDRSDAAMKFLSDLASGKASLDQPAGATPQTGSGGAVETTKPEKFSDCNLDGYV
jgi:phage gp36-like protein